MVILFTARIPPHVYEKLDELERQTWRDTLFVQGQRLRKQAQDLAREKSLRVRDRGWEEQQYAEENHKQATSFRKK